MHRESIASDRKCPVRCGIGILTVCRLLMALTALLSTMPGCASLPLDFPRPDSFVLHHTETTELGKAFAPLVAQYPEQSGFHVLVDGMDAFAARIALIDYAERSLDLQYYIWHDDLTGRYLQNRLLLAADRGVRVRLLLDDMDTAGKDPILHALDAHPNIEVRLFNPFVHRNARIIDFLTSPLRINRRMHNKTLTADSQAAILGGRNIGDEYFGAAEDVVFGDVDVLAAGPVAGDVSDSFDRFWNSRWVFPLAAFSERNAAADTELAAFRALSDDYAAKAEQSAYAEALAESGRYSSNTIAELPYAWSKWMLIYDDPEKVESDDVIDRTHLAPRLKEAFDQAERDLIIVSPYFVPGDEFTAYLADKARTGVRVRVLTNSLAATDVSLVHAGYMRYREDLVNGGVELYEFKPLDGTRGKRRANRGWRGSSRASLHAKSFTFDEEFIFIGSFNLDARSVALNTEIGVYFRSPEYAARISGRFDEQALDKAYRVELIDGRLAWTTVQDGRRTHFDVEPETGWWQRFYIRLLSIIVPESQL